MERQQPMGDLLTHKAPWPTKSHLTMTARKQGFTPPHLPQKKDHTVSWSLGRAPFFLIAVFQEIRKMKRDFLLGFIVTEQGVGVLNRKRVSLG